MLSDYYQVIMLLLLLYLFKRNLLVLLFKYNILILIAKLYFVKVSY